MGTSRQTGRLEQTVEVTCKRYTSQEGEGEEAVLLFTLKIWITSTGYTCMNQSCMNTIYWCYYSKDS